MMMSALELKQDSEWREQLIHEIKTNIKRLFAPNRVADTVSLLKARLSNVEKRIATTDALSGASKGTSGLHPTDTEKIVARVTQRCTPAKMVEQVTMLESRLGSTESDVAALDTASAVLQHKAQRHSYLCIDFTRHPATESAAKTGDSMFGLSVADTWDPPDKKGLERVSVMLKSTEPADAYAFYSQLTLVGRCYNIALCSLGSLDPVKEDLCPPMRSADCHTKMAGTLFNLLTKTGVILKEPSIEGIVTQHSHSCDGYDLLWAVLTFASPPSWKRMIPGCQNGRTPTTCL